MQEIVVGISDVKVAKGETQLVTYALGSCVGVCIYDDVAQIGGMLHAMLPDSTKIRNNSNRAKFVDTGFLDLLVLLEKNGVKKEDLVAKLAGGAQMFNFSGNTDISAIGQRNVDAAKEILAKHKIRIVAEDTGLDYGRTIEFYPEDGVLEVRAVGKGVTKL